MKRKIYLVSLLVSLFLFACSPEPESLVVMTHDSFAISESVITAFEEQNDVDVIFLPSGDAGSTLNRAILSKGAPVADVLYGIDNTYLSRALKEDLFIPYTPQAVGEFTDYVQLIPGNPVVPVDYGDVCINYDKSFFSDKELELPASFEDLLDPVYKGMLVVENPATSSPGLAFLLSTIAEYGPEGYLDYWRNLLENGAVVVNDWETAYYTNFSGSAGQGPQPMVVSYATSPAAEVIFAETTLDESPTGSLVGKNMCFRQVEYAGVLKGTKNQKIAESFIAYMISPPFQSDIPMNMFVYPVNKNAVIPQEFFDHTNTPISPAMLEAEVIAQNRDSWIEAWRALLVE